MAIEAPPFTPSNSHLRRRYVALLQGDPVIESNYERWRELKRMVIVYGLPRDEGNNTTDLHLGNERQSVPAESTASNQHAEEPCSLRGRIWKAFLGVEDGDIDHQKYKQLIERGASHYDGDIRNDTFRTFRGDAKFAERVPEHKLVRLLNAFFNELGSSSSEVGQNSDFPDYVRYVQGMNVLCAPLLYVMPEQDAYHTFCQLILKHCPKYMAPQLRGVEHGCILVDQCLEVIDPELYRHLSSRGITARIYALPLILSMFACVPPLQELLRVWDVLFAVGVHFVVLLAVAHTVLLREQLLKKEMDLMKILSSRFAPPLQSDQLISVALQLLHRLPEELLYEIGRHPLENPELPTSLPFSDETIEGIRNHMAKPPQSRNTKTNGVPSAVLRAQKNQQATPLTPPSLLPPPPPAIGRSVSLGARPDKTTTPPPVATQYVPTFFGMRPPWKF